MNEEITPPLSDEDERLAAAEAAAFPKDAWINHCVPFLAWIVIMQTLGDPAGWKYALKSVACLGLFIYYRPWQWYPKLQLKNLPLAVGVGLFVFGFWVLFETDFLMRFEWLHKGYLVVGIQPPWKLADPVQDIYYTPEVCGWSFTIIRLLGSAFVISFIEEFFWRGWLYRWMLEENFLKVDLGRLNWKMLLIISLMFASMHQRWIAGFVCGLVYGLMVIKTKDVWAAGIAHAVTNFTLGVYVLMADKYEFWA